MKSIVMRFLLFIGLSCILSCREAYETPELNKKIVIAEKCDLIGYSSNDKNYFSPSIVKGAFSNNPKHQHINLVGIRNKNAYLQSFSCDCNLSAISVFDSKSNKYNLVIYNLKNHEHYSLNLHENIHDLGKPLFSPVSSVLAFLNNFELIIYDYQTKEIDNTGLIVKDFIWSAKGRYLFLEDYDRRIWRYNLSTKDISLLWDDGVFGKNRMLSASADREHTVYFVSDHETEYSQIYKTDGILTEKQTKTQSDKFLLRRPISASAFYYLQNTEGQYLLIEKTDSIERQLVDVGVVFDFYYSERYGKSVTLYSNEFLKPSIWLSLDSHLFGGAITPWNPTVRKNPQIEIYDLQGMHNIVYKPADSKTTKWVLWLHGGPHEQVSRRYNQFIYSLVNDGLGVIAINYPGSTGNGKTFEQRDSLTSENPITYIRNLIQIIKQNENIPEYAIISVSYASNLMHDYITRYNREISRVIDFSGISTINYPSHIPVLLIAGRDDPFRKTRTVTSNNRLLLLFDHEAHAISQLKNIEMIEQSMSRFLLK